MGIGKKRSDFIERKLGSCVRNNAVLLRAKVSREVAVCASCV